MLKIVENLWAVGSPPRTPLGSLQRSPRPLVGGEGLLPPSRNHTPALGRHFRPFGPYSAVSPTVFIPPMLRDLNRTLRGASGPRWVLYLPPDPFRGSAYCLSHFLRSGDAPASITSSRPTGKVCTSTNRLTGLILYYLRVSWSSSLRKIVYSGA